MTNGLKNTAIPWKIRITTGGAALAYADACIIYYASGTVGDFEKMELAKQALMIQCDLAANYIGE